MSLFYNRAKDVGENPVQIIKDYVNLSKDGGLNAEIIVGSIRTPEDVAVAIAAGAHILTIPTKIMTQMPFNKRTEETIQEFDKAWTEFLQKSEGAKIPVVTKT